MERCYDSACGYGNRLEYCEQDARDPDGNAAFVIEALDDLLYENNDIGSGKFVIQVDKDSQFMLRSFSISHFDFKGSILPLTQTSASISHIIDKDSGQQTYVVNIGWLVENKAGVEVPFYTSYTINKFKSGEITSEMERPNLLGGGQDTAPITNYDYDQLASVLDLFAIAQRAERADNLRINPVT